jgi:hypothetical protein
MVGQSRCESARSAESARMDHRTAQWLQESREAVAYAHEACARMAEAVELAESRLIEARKPINPVTRRLVIEHSP